MNIRRSMVGHYNHAVGSYVSNDREFSDALKRKSEQVETRTGIPTNLKPVSLAEKEFLGVTDEGSKERHDQAVAQGQRDPTPKLIRP